jgi:arylsulfatase A-like enzyme
VVIITLDTTRADRLAAYGFMSGSTPAIDRLARSGVVFEQAMTTAPLTLPAHTSLFTGLLPPRHGVRDNADLPLDASHVTLAELLRARGVQTGAFVGSAVLDADRGLSEGFDEYNTGGDGSDRTLQRSAETVMNEAIRWLEGRGGSPFFLWTHLYDPHRPYEAPEPYRSAAADAYTAEISFVDAQIGRLLNTLERRGILDDTLIIVVADHGESLGEHGERDHGIFVYDSVMRVPLIIRAPRTVPGRIGGLVRITDLMPTVLDLFGVPPPSIDGVSLAGVLARRQQLPELEAYAESLYPRHFGWSPLRSLRAGRYKFIEAPKAELYDLEQDPFEERSILHDRPSVAAVMRTRLARIAAVADAPAGRRRSDTADPGVAERLASLGYIGTIQPRSVSDDSALPDPKDHIAAFESTRDRAPSSAPGGAVLSRKPR